MDRDDRWGELTNGYGDTFDPRPILKLLEHDNVEVEHGWDGWDLLWENLHHQGRVGTASYAAVPDIVGLIARAPSPNHKAYSLLVRIEACRLAGKTRPFLLG